MSSLVSLLASELRRALSRRLFKVVALLAVAGIATAAVLAFVNSEDDADSGLAQAQQDVAACERDRTVQFEKFPAEGFQCPTVEEVRGSYDRRFRYADTMPNATRGTAIALFGLSVIVAASFVGAEFGTGTVTTLLTWEPRRGRVLAAKTAAIGAVIAVGVAVLLAFLAVVFFPVASLRGTTAGVDRSLWWTMAGIWLRAAGLGLFGAFLGAGLATLTRNTAGAIGSVLGYSLIADPILGAWRQGRYRTWLLQHNFERLMGFVGQPDDPMLGVTMRQPSMTRPIVLLSIYGLGLLAIAYAAFRTRDVT